MLTNQGDLTFSKFGKTFQESLVQLIVEQRVFADQIEEVLDIEFLEFKYLRALVRKIFEYKQKYKTHPSYQNLVTIFKTEFEEENEILKESNERLYYSHQQELKLMAKSISKTQRLISAESRS